jgi:hypothetical protein
VGGGFLGGFWWLFGLLGGLWFGVVGFFGFGFCLELVFSSEKPIGTDAKKVAETGVVS